MGVRGRVVALLLGGLVLLGIGGGSALFELARASAAGLPDATRLVAGYGAAAFLLGLAALATGLAVLVRLRVLSGRIPICAGCKQVRDGNGAWRGLEAFLESHSHAEFTRGLCEACQAGLHARTVTTSARHEPGHPGRDGVESLELS